MKFHNEPCTWGFIARREVLTPFAPRSGWIWKASSRPKRPPKTQLSTKFKFTQELIEEATRLDKIIGGTQLRKRMMKEVKKEFNKTKESESQPGSIDRNRQKRKTVLICERDHVRMQHRII